MREDIKEILTTFLSQVSKDDHSTSQYVNFYDELKLKVGFGVGKTAKIPWIAFLGTNQEPQNGIFPVYYFFKEYHKLILAYGISETEKPKHNWFIPPQTKTIGQYFHQLKITPHKYGLSYVYETYNVNDDLQWDKIESDLNTLINWYKRNLQMNSLHSK